jgi:Methyltransferase domain
MDASANAKPVPRNALGGDRGVFDDIWKVVSTINSHYSMSEDELRFAVECAEELPDKPLMMELGVCHGRTLAALAMVAATKKGLIVGVDDWGLEGSIIETRNTLLDLGITGWELRKIRTQVLLWSLPLDFLLVDAGHDEANVKPDVAKYVPFVKPGGVIMFHDFDQTFDKNSPHWAVRFYAEQACGKWDDLGYVGGLKAWRRPID